MMHVREYDAIIQSHFRSSPVGRAHTGLTHDALTQRRTRLALQSSMDVLRGTSVRLRPWSASASVTLRRTTVLDCLKLGAVSSAIEGEQRVRGACRYVDRVFGNALGSSGMHVNGVVPAIGWVPYGIGCAVGALVGSILVGLCAPAALVPGATLAAVSQANFALGVLAGGCVGGAVLWAACQLSGAVGLSVKGALVLGAALCWLGHAMATSKLDMRAILSRTHIESMTPLPTAVVDMLPGVDVALKASTDTVVIEAKVKPLDVVKASASYIGASVKQSSLLSGWAPEAPAQIVTR